MRTFARYLEIAADTLLFVFFVQAFVVQAFVVPSSSMEETLLIGDHLLVNKIYYAPTACKLERIILPVGEVKRGDIVVFKYPQDPRFDFVKRAIGLPGDVIEIKDKVLFVNGKPLDEPYVIHRDYHVFNEENTFPELARRDNFGPVKVPEGYLFVLGDNRDDSNDSRFWGFLPMENLRGRPWIIYWSIKKSSREYAYSNILEWAVGTALSILEIPFRTRWNRLLRVPH